jgi:ABC-type bacteriocin/lantibiotic exporter with double-glycine peptidase domain
VRAQMGVVMQDDVLLQGSIAENIALIAPNATNVCAGLH